MQKGYIVAIAITLFITTLFVMTTIHNYGHTLDQLTRTQQSQINIMDLLAKELPSIWEQPNTDPEVLKQLNETERDYRLEKKFEGSNITRQELGRASWTILHMISATLPEDFDKEFALKINIFLNLFGQFFPCKYCARHFLKLLDQYPYNGRSRVDFMTYMCKLHNLVNERIHHDQFNCSMIHEKWGGSCGCEDALEESIRKYELDGSD